MRPWRYSLLAVAAILAVGSAVVPRPDPPTSYRRFTSLPLQDGMRYTFLYPSALNNVSLFSFPASYHGKYLESLEVSRQESRLPGLALLQRWFRPETEFVSVTVEKQTFEPLKSSRLERQGVRNRDEIAHRVYVDDPRAHEHFILGHVDDFGTALYNRHDRVVADSFRVLLPGESVPSP